MNSPRSGRHSSQCSLDTFGVMEGGKMNSSTSEGLRWFGRVVRWITTLLALYIVWVSWRGPDFVPALIVATVIFVVGNGIGWWVQVIAERNR